MTWLYPQLLIQKSLKRDLKMCKSSKTVVQRFTEIVKQREATEPEGKKGGSKSLSPVCMSTCLRKW